MFKTTSLIAGKINSSNVAFKQNKTEAILTRKFNLKDISRHLWKTKRGRHHCLLNKVLVHDSNLDFCVIIL